jgi:low molecular weight phosphotyrosine protein phosphatase
MGEAVLRDIAKERKIDLTVDSAGTAAYHVGEEPDDRSVYDDPPQAFTRH